MWPSLQHKASFHQALTFLRDSLHHPLLFLRRTHLKLKHFDSNFSVQRREEEELQHAVSSIKAIISEFSEAGTTSGNQVDEESEDNQSFNQMENPINHLKQIIEEETKFDFFNPNNERDEGDELPEINRGLREKEEEEEEEEEEDPMEGTVGFVE